jgi:hypothetical protein
MLAIRRDRRTKVRRWQNERRARQRIWKSLKIGEKRLLFEKLSRQLLATIQILVRGIFAASIPGNAIGLAEAKLWKNAAFNSSLLTVTPNSG